jgi:hypothetical protein
MEMTLLRDGMGFGTLDDIKLSGIALSAAPCLSVGDD